MNEFKFHHSERYTSREKPFGRKYPREMLALRKNLDRTIGMLQMLEMPITQIKFGPLRYEGGRVFRLSPQGGGKGLNNELRLYFSVDESEKTIYLLALGTKSDQNADIQYCKKEAQTMEVS